MVWPYSKVFGNIWQVVLLVSWPRFPSAASKSSKFSSDLFHFLSQLVTRLGIVKDRDGLGPGTNLQQRCYCNNQKVDRDQERLWQQAKTRQTSCSRIWLHLPEDSKTVLGIPEWCFPHHFVGSLKTESAEDSVALCDSVYHAECAHVSHRTGGLKDDSGFSSSGHHREGQDTHVSYTNHVPLFVSWVLNVSESICQQDLFMSAATVQQSLAHPYGTALSCGGSCTDINQNHLRINSHLIITYPLWNHQPTMI